jgi:hypothetical protein
MSTETTIQVQNEASIRGFSSSKLHLDYEKAPVVQV